MLRVVLENLNDNKEILNELETVGLLEGYISISPEEDVTVVRPLKLNYESLVNEVGGKPSFYILKNDIVIVYNDNFLPENLEHNPLATNFSRVRLKGTCMILKKNFNSNSDDFNLLNLDIIIKIINELVKCKKNVDSLC
ncbi:hypothetical protein [Clostridium tarantellae]|uniref:Uncharacterized protein n=1 Tax=Clostridium tarantellae TaxID=39493 RepID=A0A6I1MMY0_9CLOT|nr:hypothetical protein [Clostridium tarantellae]MPQ44745.1 hypothetical protein [Clostridium tarantellae]